MFNSWNKQKSSKKTDDFLDDDIEIGDGDNNDDIITNDDNGGCCDDLDDNDDGDDDLDDMISKIHEDVTSVGGKGVVVHKSSTSTSRNTPRHVVGQQRRRRKGGAAAGASRFHPSPPSSNNGGVLDRRKNNNDNNTRSTQNNNGSSSKNQHFDALEYKNYIGSNDNHNGKKGHYHHVNNPFSQHKMTVEDIRDFNDLIRYMRDHPKKVICVVFGLVAFFCVVKYGHKYNDKHVHYNAKKELSNNRRFNQFQNNGYNSHHSNNDNNAINNNNNHPDNNNNNKKQSSSTTTTKRQVDEEQLMPGGGINSIINSLQNQLGGGGSASTNDDEEKSNNKNNVKKSKEKKNKVNSNNDENDDNYRSSSNNNNSKKKKSSRNNNDDDSHNNRNNNAFNDDDDQNKKKKKSKKTKKTTTKKEIKRKAKSRFNNFNEEDEEQNENGKQQDDDNNNNNKHHHRSHKRPKDASKYRHGKHYKIIPNNIRNSFSNVWEDVTIDDTPLFFHVPKSGGTTLEDIMTHCLNLVTASKIGHTEGHGEENLLEVNTYKDKGRYVNVDTTSIQGIKHAKSLQLVQSNLADVIVTHRINEITTIFNDNNNDKKGDDGNNKYKGRVFVMLRHPISRAISMFYYLQKAKWEPTYDPTLSNMSLLDYAHSTKVENNWIVRTLTNNMSSRITDQHLKIAKEILRTKMIVGILENFDESLRRYELYFNWYKTKVAKKNPQRAINCIEHKSNNYRSNKSEHDYPKPDKDDPAYKRLRDINWADIELYNYAKDQLFKDQSVLVDNTISISSSLSLLDEEDEEDEDEEEEEEF